MSKLNAEQLRKLIVRIEDMIGELGAHSGTWVIVDALEEALDSAHDALGVVEAGEGVDGAP